MIREFLESVYKRTIGALWRTLSRSAVSVASRWGIVQLLYVAAILVLMAGIVNAVVLPYPSQAQPVAPTGSETIPETFIDAMVILLGGAGIYMTYVSGRQTTRSRMVNLYLGFALLLISISVMVGVYLITYKALTG
jgi:hypothetical protein